jgi:hypothetical protein
MKKLIAILLKRVKIRSPQNILFATQRKDVFPPFFLSSPS